MLTSNMIEEFSENDCQKVEDWLLSLNNLLDSVILLRLPFYILKPKKNLKSKKKKHSRKQNSSTHEIVTVSMSD